MVQNISFFPEENNEFYGTENKKFTKKKQIGEK